MKRHGAFTLIELLLVIGIIVILTGLLIPTVVSVSRARSLTTSSLTINSEFELARQTAVTRNREVEVRLYKLPEESATVPSVYRALQSFLIEPDGAQPLGPCMQLSAPVAMSTEENTSSLMSNTDLPEQPAVVTFPLPMVGKNYVYRRFRFRPDGATDLPASKLWFLSIYVQRTPVKSNGLPANFATIQIDPVTGRSKIYRP